MPKRRAPLMAAVLARAANSRPGFAPWHTKLPADVQAELAQMKASFLSGETGLQKRAFCRAVIAEMRERGYRVPGVQGVEQWLERTC